MSGVMMRRNFLRECVTTKKLREAPSLLELFYGLHKYIYSIFK